MIQVAFAADANYLPHVATLLASLRARHDPDELRCHLLHLNSLPDPDRRTLEEYAKRLSLKLQCHGIDPGAVASLPDMGRISRVMWLRLFLPELLHDQPRVLYLDCDTLALDRLDDLWATPLGDAWLGAVSNVFERGWEHRPSRLGLASRRDYFNSGVLLMDLDAWRAQRCADKILDIARDGSRKIIWPDQDALNLVCAGRWKPLHPRWNCQNSLFFFAHAVEYFGPELWRQATTAPGIVHFEGGPIAKPWHFLCKNPRRQDYLRFRNSTPWPLAQLEGTTLVHRLLRPLPFFALVKALRLLDRWRAQRGQRLPASS